MAKRKAREDPDSSDEDVARQEQRANRKGAKKSDKQPTKKKGKAPDEGPFDYHTRPTEAETRACSNGLPHRVTYIAFPVMSLSSNNAVEH